MVVTQLEYPPTQTVVWSKLGAQKAAEEETRKKMMHVDLEKVTHAVQRKYVYVGKTVGESMRRVEKQTVRRRKEIEE